MCDLSQADIADMREPVRERLDSTHPLSTKALVFDAFTLVAALSVFGFSLAVQPAWSVDDLTLTLTLALAGMVTMLVATEGNRKAVVRSSRFGLSVDAIWVFAAVLLLPFPLMILATALARWSSASVNLPHAGRVSPSRLVSYISITAISGFVASVIHQSINERVTAGMDSSLREVGAVVVSAVAFSLLSHLLTGVTFALTHGQALRDQRAVTGIIVEVAVLCHGGLVAWAWTKSPAILLLGLPALTLVQRALMHERLEERANRDAKTGVGSIGWWREAANLEVARAGPDRQIGFLALDLDLFKKVNDTHGHLAGDRVLKAVGDVLQAEVRGADKVGRFGGEEFVVLLPGASPHDVAAVAERLRAGIERLRVDVGGQFAQVTVSIGGAVYPLNGVTVNEALQYADRNLYYAKRHGRNQVGMGSAGSGSSDQHAQPEQSAQHSQQPHQPQQPQPPQPPQPPRTVQPAQPAQPAQHR